MGTKRIGQSKKGVTMDMNRIELAKKYFAENLDPVQDLCPELIQHWYTSNGVMHWSNKTGERTLYITRVPYNIRTYCVKSEYPGVYVRYVRELDALEFAIIRLDVGGRGKEKHKVDWKFVSYYRRLLVFRNDPNAYAFDGFRKGGIYYCKDVLSLMGYYQQPLFNPRGFEEVVAFDPDAKSLERSWMSWYLVERWYATMLIKRKIKNAEVNDIVSADLPLPELVPGQNGVFAKPINDKYLMLRVFTKKWGGDGHDENYRLLISDKGDVSIFQKESVGWKRVCNVPSWYGMKQIENVAELENWNPTKYVLQCVKDDQGNVKLDDIVQVLRHPIVEKLAKAGYPKIARSISRNATVAATLKNELGVKKESKKTAIKDLGINRHLLKAIEDAITSTESRYCRGDELAIGKFYKELFGKDDVSYLSNETIDELFAGAKRIIRSGGIRRICDDRNRYWYYRAHNEDAPISEADRSFIIRLCKVANKTPNMDIVQYYVDTKRMFQGLINRPEIDIRDFDDYQSLCRIHDRLVEQQTQENMARDAAYAERRRRENEEYKKKFEKLQEERIKKYEENGDKFSIRVPRDLEEISNEGSALHHCVGGYRINHANGDTTILFLRRTEEVDKPFYTIEVKNDRVVQIHGCCNRWLGNNPEAVPFVYKWLMERGILFDKKMLLNLGTGYSPSSQNLDESYLCA